MAWNIALTTSRSDTDVILDGGIGGREWEDFLCTVIQTINTKLKAPHEALASNHAWMPAPKVSQSRPAMQMHRRVLRIIIIMLHTIALTHSCSIALFNQVRRFPFHPSSPIETARPQTLHIIFIISLCRCASHDQISEPQLLPESRPPWAHPALAL